jgi:2-polyprenyl-6-methoxyphenol hydroxylase-like FAD-dependent oxidoreductase
MTDPGRPDTDVLVVGAGPVGLTVAIELRRRGVDCRVVERNDATVETSRALGIQPRTLQLFEDLGVLDPVLSEGVRIERASIRAGGRELFSLDLAAVESPYPYLWSLPQSRTESILLDRLRELGGDVEFERELVGFGQREGGVTAVVEHGDGSGRSETIAARWLVGCDGARSRVRRTLGLAFEGETKAATFLNVDADLAWDRPETVAGAWFHEDGVVATLPLPGERRWRVLADVTGLSDAERERFETDDAAAETERLLRERTGDERATLTRIVWATTFTVDQRMVQRYRRGRVFLAGDAAHVHSPVGGVGMNTGIQDAHNLGWKLALVVAGAAPDCLLETYGTERLPVAARVLGATGPATDLLTSSNPLLGVVRDRAFSRLLGSERVQARVLRADTQLDVEYRGSPLSNVHVDAPLSEMVDVPSLRVAVGRARRAWSAPKAGERAPDGPCSRASGRPTSLYREIHGTTGFTLLLFAGTDATAATDAVGDLLGVARAVDADLVRPYLVVPDRSTVPESVDERGDVTVLVDDDGRLHDQYGATAPALYLLRPDDYVGFRSGSTRTAPLLAYLGEWLRPPHAVGDAGRGGRGRAADEPESHPLGDGTGDGVP